MAPVTPNPASITGLPACSSDISQGAITGTMGMSVRSSARTQKPKSSVGWVVHLAMATVLARGLDVSPRPIEVNAGNPPLSSSRQWAAVITTRGWTRVPVQTTNGPTIMTVVGHAHVVARLPPTMGSAVGDHGPWPGRLSQPSEDQPPAIATARHAQRRAFIGTTLCPGRRGTRNTV